MRRRTGRRGCAFHWPGWPRSSTARPQRRRRLLCPPETEVLGRAAAAELSDDDKTQIDALLRADHDNPFGFLGLQWNEARGGFDLRVLQPGASRLTAIDSDGAPLFELKRVHPEGFFIGVSGRDRPFAYRLRREGPGGTVELDDPYRFPPLLG